MLCLAGGVACQTHPLPRATASIRHSKRATSGGKGAEGFGSEIGMDPPNRGHLGAMTLSSYHKGAWACMVPLPGEI